MSDEPAPDRAKRENAERDIADHSKENPRNCFTLSAISTYCLQVTLSDSGEYGGRSRGELPPGASPATITPLPGRNTRRRRWHFPLTRRRARACRRVDRRHDTAVDQSEAAPRASLFNFIDSLRRARHHRVPRHRCHRVHRASTAPPSLWTTDVNGTPRTDFGPDETVFVHGSGFLPLMAIDIPITRPNGSIVVGDGSFNLGWDTTTTDSAGNLYYEYISERRQRRIPRGDVPVAVGRTWFFRSPDRVNNFHGRRARYGSMAQPAHRFVERWHDSTTSEFEVRRGRQHSIPLHPRHGRQCSLQTARRKHLSGLPAV